MKTMFISPNPALQRRLAALLLGALLLPLAACGGGPGAEGDLMSQPTGTFETVELGPDAGRVGAPPSGGKDENCPGVESALIQIVTAEDPLAAAQDRGLKTDEDRIQVLLVLASSETGFLAAYDVQVGKVSGYEVQAFVPAARVCELAMRDEVLAVRLPAVAVPQ